MSKSSFLIQRVALAGLLVCTLGANSVFANSAFPVLGDINGLGEDPNDFGVTNAFNDSGVFVLDESAVFQGNDILVTTYNGASDFNGWGIAVGISNGENGIDSHACQAPGSADCELVEGVELNVDIPNATPVNSAIVAANTGAGTSGTGKLSNGNVIRASMWMRSDPNSPVTAGPDPQIEGIFKIELWKEGLSGFGDFDGPGDSDRGDRIWDQDQQGGDGSHADINADGDTGQFGGSASVTLSTEEWRQLVVEYVVDDNPADPGNTFSPWFIGSNQYTVADVEEVRAVFFSGDWTGSSDFTGGGSYWSDNLLIEVFTDQAAANAVDPTTSNPAPVEVAADFDGDGDVDGNDFLGLQQFDPAGIPAWQGAYPSGAASSAIAAVPEPSSVILAIFGATLLAGTKRRR